LTGFTEIELVELMAHIWEHYVDQFPRESDALEVSANDADRRALSENLIQLADLPAHASKVAADMHHANSVSLKVLTPGSSLAAAVASTSLIETPPDSAMIIDTTSTPALSAEPDNNNNFTPYTTMTSPIGVGQRVIPTDINTGSTEKVDSTSTVRTTSHGLSLDVNTIPTLLFSPSDGVHMGMPTSDALPLSSPLTTMESEPITSTSTSTTEISTTDTSSNASSKNTRQRASRTKEHFSNEKPENDENLNASTSSITNSARKNALNSKRSSSNVSRTLGENGVSTRSRHR
jgi:hypothetical protein